MKCFRQVLEDCNLMDGGYSRPWLAWEREILVETNIHERLDRGVVNFEWINLFSNFMIEHLPYSFSNHCPLLVQMNKFMNRISKRLFRFEAWWVLKDSC